MDARVVPTWHKGASGWQVMGPRVSGPKYDVWGDNARASRPSTFYMQVFRAILPCGTMSNVFSVDQPDFYTILDFISLRL